MVARKRVENFELLHFGIQGTGGPAKHVLKPTLVDDLLDVVGLSVSTTSSWTMYMKQVSLLRLGRVALDGRGGFLQERAPPVRDCFDLREDLRFLLRRTMALPSASLSSSPSSLVQNCLHDVAVRIVCSSCCIRRVAKPSRTLSRIDADRTMAAETITVLMRNRKIGPR